MDSWEMGIEKLKQVLSWFPKIWNLEILSTQSNPITLGTVVIGIVLLSFGYYFSRKLSAMVGKRLLSRFDLEKSLRHTIETICFYIMMVLVTLFVLGLLNVPLTVFTYFGSALVIGVGFGAQKIFYNVLSGFVIMIETPLKVGDIIEVDGIAGSVEYIGTRATRIKSLDNTHIVIPNGSLLENNLLNWTLSDDVVRANVNVGIAYGSDTRQAESLLKKAIAEHEKVLKYPEPQVMFSDFGDNALNFVAYFWTRVPNVMMLRQVQSDIRFRVDELFRESHIVIAFPQRDVHINSTSPLQVEIQPPR